MFSKNKFGLAFLGVNNIAPELTRELAKDATAHVGQKTSVAVG